MESSGSVDDDDDDSIQKDLACMLANEEFLRDIVHRTNDKKAEENMSKAIVKVKKACSISSKEGISARNSFKTLAADKVHIFNNVISFNNKSNYFYYILYEAFNPFFS